jgi:hypothetical protein
MTVLGELPPTNRLERGAARPPVAIVAVIVPVAPRPATIAPIVPPIAPPAAAPFATFTPCRSPGGGSFAKRSRVS